MQIVLNFETASPINKEKFTKQNREVYEYLLSKNINCSLAIGMGIYHLHSRISDLRNKHKIKIYGKTIRVNNINCQEYSLRPFNKPKTKQNDN